MQNNLFQFAADTWTMLDQWGILIGLITGLANLLAIVAAVFAYLNRERLRRWFTRNHFPHVGETASAEKHEALIFTVSKKEVPLWMIKTNQPKVIGLIATAESYENAKQIQSDAQKQGIEVLPITQIEDADEPAETKESCRLLIKAMHNKGHKSIAVDITGGKVPMSMGAFMAAEEMQADTLYVSTRYDTQLKQPDMRSAKAIIISRPE